MTTEAELLATYLGAPADIAAREVYADWLEDRGDPRAAFVRAHWAVHDVDPDHPHRLELEDRLSQARKGLDAGWLATIEPERRHLWQQTRPTCSCMSERPPRLHDEPQDTTCDAWKKLVDFIDESSLRQPEVFAPLSVLSGPERAHIVTLPPNIGAMTSVRRLNLYGSYLVRLPREVGLLTSLQEFTPYQSGRLHWFPFEVTRCGYAQSTVSTRVLYGNFKVRSAFPHLERPRSRAPVARPCSVCDQPFDDRGAHRVWVSCLVGTDVLPLLVNACSAACVARLPPSAANHAVGPHQGGPDVRWQDRSR